MCPGGWDMHRVRVACGPGGGARALWGLVRGRGGAHEPRGRMRGVGVTARVPRAGASAPWGGGGARVHQEVGVHAWWATPR